jgi:tRNA pseudouridine55 synthase
LGTLDPIATGVLPVMIGQATRLAQFWDKSEKVYEAVMRLGFATTTYDRQGEPVGDATEPDMGAEQIEARLAPMRGDIEQIPPPVSAKKLNGVPAYRLTRKNVPVDLAPVRVSIYELTLLGVQGSGAHIRVRCSAGTYIRAIAHQLGQTLGCGAHVESLIRIESGPFNLDHAFTLERLQQLKDEGRFEDAVIPAADLLPQFPRVFVDDLTATRIRQGREFTASAFRADPGARHVRAIDANGRLVAIGRIALPHVYHPVVVMNQTESDGLTRHNTNST